MEQTSSLLGTQRFWKKHWREVSSVTRWLAPNRSTNCAWELWLSDWNGVKQESISVPKEHRKFDKILGPNESTVLDILATVTHSYTLLHSKSVLNTYWAPLRRNLAQIMPHFCWSGRLFPIGWTACQILRRFHRFREAFSRPSNSILRKIKRKNPSSSEFFNLKKMSLGKRWYVDFQEL